MNKRVYITIGEIYSRVLRAPADAWVIIRQECKARPEGFQYMPKFQSGMWDGFISLLKRNLIPTGLLRHVQDTLEAEGYSCKCNFSVDIYRYEYDLDMWLGGDIANTIHGITLRDYQVDAVLTLLSKERGIAKMATNAGKTATYAAIIKILGNSNALIVVQSKDLLYQTQERLKDYLQRDVGLIGDSHRDETDICVATIQTLNSLCKRSKKVAFATLFRNNKILIIDECHHVANNRTFDILMDIPGWHRFGMSGTPLNRGKLNDMKLIACTGPVCVNVTNAQLIKEEWSAKPLVHVYDTPDQPNDWLWDADYQDAYDACIINNIYRNVQVVNLALNAIDKECSVLIIVTRIAHGLKLHRLISEQHSSDLSYMFVHGNSSVERRQVALRMLDEQACIVIATNIFDEGVDVPALDTIILACGGKSQIRLLQRIGRGLRKKAGENVVHIHDFLDSDNKYLLNHSEERLDVYEREGFEVQYEGDAA